MGLTPARCARRRRPIDYMIAACAESSDDVVLWHWDGDLTVICDFAQIPHEAEHARAHAKRNRVSPLA